MARSADEMVGRRHKFDGVGDSFAARFGDIDGIASIVVHFWAYIQAFNSMWGPCSPYLGLFMD